MWLRGVRGATCATTNSKEAIVDTTKAMLQRIIEANGMEPDDIASAFFSTTRDPNAEFPAIAARQLGRKDVPRMCIHWNTNKNAAEVRHVYINGAEKLRPDLIREG